MNPLPKAGLLRKLLVTITILILTLGTMLTLPTQWHGPAQCSSSIEIFVVNYGYHTGLIVPYNTEAYDWAGFLPPMGNVAPSYLEIGWGDKDFYMSGGFPLDTALRALLWPTTSVIHTFEILDHPQKAFTTSEVRQMKICATDYLRLVRFIQGSFLTNTKNQLQYLKVGLYGSASAFYEARGIYSFFYNCNNWVAEALHTAGVNTPLWGGIAPVIMWHLPQHSH